MIRLKQCKKHFILLAYTNVQGVDDCSAVTRHLIKLFTIKFDRSLEKFDDSEFQAYIKDKDVLSVENHFFMCRERHMCC